jgi:hypothetical protein
MATPTLSSIALLIGAAAAGAALDWLGTALHYRAKLLNLAGQFDQSERARQKAQDLALQSRQQVESLQQALSDAKRDGVIQSAAASARAAATAAEAAKAAQAKARAELIRQLDRADTADASAHGFADTQPLRT